MEAIWIILGTLTLVFLVIYWNSKNSVWGGLTLGVLIGFMVTLYIGFDWSVILKGAILGTICGFLSDLLGNIADKMRSEIKMPHLSSYDSSKMRVLKSDEFNTLYEYYKIQYSKDLENFKNACPNKKHTSDLRYESFFAQDLEYLKETNHSLLKKKHFIYFLVIHTAFLMTVHKYFIDTYENFKIINKGIVFEYGLSNTFILPWDILIKLRISFDKELFSDCLGLIMSEMMTDYHFCEIIPADFINKFIDDPDLSNPKTIYGSVWKEIAIEEWFQTTKSICPKV